MALCHQTPFKQFWTAKSILRTKTKSYRLWSMSYPLHIHVQAMKFIYQRPALPIACYHSLVIVSAANASDIASAGFASFLQHEWWILQCICENLLWQQNVTRCYIIYIQTHEEQEIIRIAWLIWLHMAPILSPVVSSPMAQCWEKSEVDGKACPQ